MMFQTLVGAGYQYPPALTVAPGQVIPVLVTGLETVLPSPGLVEAQGVPLPTTLAGISLTLTQTAPNKTWQLPIFWIQQTNRCGSGGSGSPCLMTAVMVEFPFDLAVPIPEDNLVPQPYATLTLTENGTASQTFLVQPVFSRVHILQSCDMAGANFGGTGCYPLVTFANGTLLQNNMAQQGEPLVMYAFGLGAVTPTPALGAPSPLPPATAVEQYYTRFDFSPNATPSMPLITAANAGNGLTFVGLTPGQIGLYQINFVVPTPPPGDAACFPPVNTNLTVSIASGAGGSFDGAAICVFLGPDLPPAP